MLIHLFDDWYENRYSEHLGDGLKHRHWVSKKFKPRIKKVNGKLQIFIYCYQLTRRSEFHITYYVGNTEFPKEETIEIRKKDYLNGEPHLIWQAYEKLGNLIGV